MSRGIRNVSMLLSLGLLVGSVGCADPNEGISAEEQARQSAADRIRELEDQLAQMERDRSADQDEIARLKRELDALRAQANAVPENWRGVPGGAMTSIEGTMLFDSGKAELRSEGKSALADVARVINEKYPNYDIYIFGHTDDVPITYSKWADNYELSCQRALSVLRALQSQGVSQPMAACGWGENRPIADNASAEARQANRRVEVYAMAPQ